MYQPQWVHLSRTEEPAKVGTCARDRRALQQLALNVHVKHSDPDLTTVTCPRQRNQRRSVHVARDRRALQQLVLNEHVKHFDLT